MAVMYVNCWCIFCTFQIFPINGTCVNARRLKIVFETSSDFFGRITIYVLDVVGTREWNQQTSWYLTASRLLLFLYISFTYFVKFIFCTDAENDGKLHNCTVLKYIFIHIVCHILKHSHWLKSSNLLINTLRLILVPVGIVQLQCCPS